MTLEQVRSKTERIREFSALPFLLVAAVSMLGALFPAGAAGRDRRTRQRRRRRLDADGDRPRAAHDAGPVLLLRRHGADARTSSRRCCRASSRWRVISILWIVVGFSLAFGDSINGLIGNPRTFFMFTRVGAATHPGSRADDSAGPVRAVSAEVRDHHAGAHHRLVRRARALHELPALHGALQPVHLRAARALDLASRRLPAQAGRARLRRRHGRAHVGRASPRWPARWCSAAARPTRPARRTRRPTSRS